MYGGRLYHIHLHEVRRQLYRQFNGSNGAQLFGNSHGSYLHKQRVHHVYLHEVRQQLYGQQNGGARTQLFSDYGFVILYERGLYRI